MTQPVHQSIGEKSGSPGEPLSGHNHAQIAGSLELNEHALDFVSSADPEASVTQRIDVNVYIERYSLHLPQVIDAVRACPILCYLLGSVTAEPQGRDARPDGIERSIFYLTEGSGMFALTHADDAERWKGIFNHIVGSARQVQWMAKRLKQISPNQREALQARGFNFTEFDRLSAETLRDFMLISHSGRRAADEYKWHGLRDAAHPSQDPGSHTYHLLEQAGAAVQLLDLMRVETHVPSLVQRSALGFLPNIVDNITTYCDWTFGQQPLTLRDRFAGLQRSGRAESAVLEMLEGAGAAFERALTDVLSTTIWSKMAHAALPDWEIQIREAYLAAARN
jgi:hypothetical protein